MQGLELTAVVLGILYLLLAMHERIACWYAAFASTAIFLYLFYDARLLMESALQLYYLAMAVYGWWHWRHPPKRHATLPISRFAASQHIIAIGGVLLAAGVSGWLLAQYSDAALPYLDSFTTWGSILTTWMVARKILENWLYWLVIDASSIYLYLDRELFFTAALFMAYVVIVIFGYRRWLQQYRQQ